MTTNTDTPRQKPIPHPALSLPSLSEVENWKLKIEKS